LVNLLTGIAHLKGLTSLYIVTLVQAL
jgi:hypothetical protein